ncbi:MAG: hypothetical protein M9920_02675 [Verrucomicrobiae bacterium]|nr:hypothetical protein [Verrucomicrobiae bacterium]
MKQSIVTVDMEGVLTPESWIAGAENIGIPKLSHARHRPWAKGGDEPTRASNVPVTRTWA